MDKKYLKEEEKSVEKLLQQHNFSFPKLLRIRKSFEYKALYRYKKRIFGTFLALEYRVKKDLVYPRLGITPTSKIGRANVRNKFKRILREVFRLNQKKIQSNLEINALAKKLPKNFTFNDLKKDFLYLISQIKK